MVSKEGSSHTTKGEQQKPGERETGKDERKEKRKCWQWGMSRIKNRGGVGMGWG